MLEDLPRNVGIAGDDDNKLFVRVDLLYTVRKPYTTVEEDRMLWIRVCEAW